MITSNAFKYLYVEIRSRSRLAESLVEAQLLTKGGQEVQRVVDSIWSSKKAGLFYMKQVEIVPGQHPLWGNLRSFQRDPLATIETARQAGDMVRWRFGPLWFHQANHPKLVRQILVNQARKFHKTERNKEVFRPLLGEGLLVSDGEFWRRQRSMVQPAFHSQRIRAYGQVMVEEAEAMLARWSTRESVELHQEMMQVTLAIVARTLFDTRLESDDFSKVSAAMDIVLEHANGRFARMINLPTWLPTPSNRRAQKAMAALDRVLQDIIDQRRRSGEDRGDLLSMLLFSTDDQGERMTDKQVRDEAMTLFLAGHETTANALTWTWTLLARHPQVLEALQHEVDAVVGGGKPTVEDLDRLSLHDKVIKEAMRLYPPAWIIARQPIEDVMIGDYLLPEGSRVFISAWGLHHDPELYDDPGSFRPDRFTAEAEAERPRYAYIPFGGGPRICIGNSFASMEMQLVLAAMIQRVRLELDREQDLTPEPLVTLRPLAPIPVELRWRQQPGRQPARRNAA